MSDTRNIPLPPGIGPMLEAAFAAAHADAEEPDAAAAVELERLRAIEWADGIDVQRIAGELADIRDRLATLRHFLLRSMGRHPAIAELATGYLAAGTSAGALESAAWQLLNHTPLTTHGQGDTAAETGCQGDTEAIAGGRRKESVGLGDRGQG